jgi:hypothetical protein
MPLSKLSKQIAAKALAAAVLLMVLAGVAGSQLAPKVPLYRVLFYSFLGAAALLLIVVVATVASLTLRQFILRKGGTDTQWFWFSSEPPGLVNLRSQVHDAQTKTEG